MTLAEFLLARIVDDEKWARQRRDEDFRKHRVSARRLHLEPDHCERVLARCAADRRIVELHSADHECTVPGDGYAGVFAADGSMPVICPTMLLLAAPYAAHPDYNEEWRP